jgi:ABC-type amino acid transport substrate-binding protein
MLKKLFLLFLACFFSLPAFAGPVFDRINETKTLRCAYLIYPPETIKDANTGKLSGIVVELVNRAAEHLHWTIDWTAEVGFADMFDGLKSGKYDALCAGLWKNPDRAQQALFTMPINYGVYYAYVRQDDHRFDKSLSAINDKNITIGVIDGEYGSFVAKQSYAQAKTHSLPQLSEISMILEAVATKKADVAFIQQSAAANYLTHNPGKLRMLETPVRVMPAPAIALPFGEERVKYLLDSAFEFMLDTGEVEAILRKHDPELHSYRLIAKSYQ